MISDKNYNLLADEVYRVDSVKVSEPYRKGDTIADGKYKVLETEDNPFNGMQAMAVVPIVNGSEDYSNITIAYAGTNIKDLKDVNTDFQMIGVGNTTTLNTGNIDNIELVESQAKTALKFAEEIKKEYRNASITTTGHSLGQSLAMYVALKNNWYNVGFNGPDIHNMISLEEMEYMRMNPQRFKNYRANYDYIGGITGDILIEIPYLMMLKMFYKLLIDRLKEIVNYMRIKYAINNLNLCIRR